MIPFATVGMGWNFCEFHAASVDKAFWNPKTGHGQYVVGPCTYLVVGDGCEMLQQRWIPGRRGAR